MREFSNVACCVRFSSGKPRFLQDLRENGCAAELTLIDDNRDILRAVAALNDSGINLVNFCKGRGYLPARRGYFTRVGCLEDCLRVLRLA